MKQEISEKPVVAAFDFDGTITYSDSLFPFLQFTSGIWLTYAKLFLELPALLGFLGRIIPRQMAKERVLSRFYRGMPIALLQEQGKSFAQGPIRNLLRPEAMRRFEWHRDQGHRCVLISASIEVYLHPWAKMIGFQDVICSKLEVDGEGIVTGRLNGGNCWGKEKVRRLENLLGNREDYVLHAYGDSRGDKELLEAADYPHFKKMPQPGMMPTECLP